MHEIFNRLVRVLELSLNKVDVGSRLITLQKNKEILQVLEQEFNLECFQLIKYNFGQENSGLEASTQAQKKVHKAQQHTGRSYDFFSRGYHIPVE